MGRFWTALVERVNVTFDNDDLFHAMPQALIMFAILAGGSIVLFLIRMLVRKITFPKSQWSLVNTGHEVKAATPAGTATLFAPKKCNGGLAARHVLVELVFMILLFLTFWVAAYTAGFNFLSSSYITIGISLIGTYMFAAALQNFGSGFWANIENIYQEGNYIRMTGMGVEGFLVEKNALNILLRRRDPKTGGTLEYRVPQNAILNQVTERDYFLENEPSTLPLVADEGTTDSRILVRPDECETKSKNVQVNLNLGGGGLRFRTNKLVSV
jgi:hypothetical protein